MPCSLRFAIFSIVLIFSFDASAGLAQELALIDLAVAPRVDTTQANVKDVYQLWRAYLSDEPETIKDSALWLPAEKARYSDYDITRQWTYGYESGGYNIHDAFGLNPLLLGIDRESEYYAIRTLYAAKDLKNGLVTMQTVYASEEEEGEWKLRNALPIRTANWGKKQIGQILFIYSSEETFDEEQARKAAAFADSLNRTFGLDNVDTIEYYVASDVNEMSFIRGLDYLFDSTDGTALSANNQIFVGNGEEAYLHEIVHVLFKRFNLIHFVNEGLATYLGGWSVEETYRDMIEETQQEVREGDPSKVNLDNALLMRFSTKATYVTSAMILDELYQIGGVDLVKSYLQEASDEDGFYRALFNIFGVEREQADAWWRNFVLSYQ